MKKVIVAIIALVLVVGIGLTLFFVLGGKKGAGKKVVLTVNGDLNIDISGNIADIINTVNDNGGKACRTDVNILLDVDKSGRVIRSKKNFNFAKDFDSVDFWINLWGGRFNKDAVETPGFFEYYFRDDRTTYSCDGLSLFDGWNGIVSKLGKYLTDENSVEAANNYRFALYKDGKIIPLCGIRDKYSSKVEKLKFYDRNCTQYFTSEKGYSTEKTRKCINRVVGSKFFTMAVGRESECNDNLLAMLFAMVDYGKAFEDGEIENYGCIAWKDDPSEPTLDISVAASKKDIENFLHLAK